MCVFYWFGEIFHCCLRILPVFILMASPSLPLITCMLDICLHFMIHDSWYLLHGYHTFDMGASGDLAFPDITSGKEPTCQCRRHKRCSFDPWVEKTSWKRERPPITVFLPGEYHGQRSLADYGPGAKSPTGLM